MSPRSGSERIARRAHADHRAGLGVALAEGGELHAPCPSAGCTGCPARTRARRPPCARVARRLRMMRRASLGSLDVHHAVRLGVSQDLGHAEAPLSPVAGAAAGRRSEHAKGATLRGLRPLSPLCIAAATRRCRETPSAGRSAPPWRRRTGTSPRITSLIEPRPRMPCTT